MPMSLVSLKRYSRFRQTTFILSHDEITSGGRMKFLPRFLAGVRVWRLLIAVALGTGSGLSFAGQPVGTLSKVSGPISIKKTDGSVKVLVAGEEIEFGDTLMTGKNTYALVRFLDKSEVTLRPGTTFKIDGPGAEKLVQQHRQKTAIEPGS
jgi:hypothetical protein